MNILIVISALLLFCGLTRIVSDYTSLMHENFYCLYENQKKYYLVQGLLNHALAVFKNHKIMDLFKASAKLDSQLDAPETDSVKPGSANLNSVTVDFAKSNTASLSGQLHEAKIQSKPLIIFSDYAVDEKNYKAKLTFEELHSEPLEGKNKIKVSAELEIAQDSILAGTCIFETQIRNNGTRAGVENFIITSWAAS